MKRVFFSAAELSAELYSAEILRRLRKRLDIEAFGVGGRLLEGAGLEVIYPNTELHLGGIAEVVPSIAKVLKLLRFLQDEILRRESQLVFLADFPDFHLMLAKRLKKRGFRGKIIHFISPTVWAWREGRLKKIKKYIDLEVLIYPFEVEIYRRWNIPHFFAGHPLFELVKPEEDRTSFRKRLGLEGKPLVGLMPGSRPQEVKRHLPVLQEAVKLIKEKVDANFLIVVAESVSHLLKPAQLEGMVRVEGKERYSAMAACDVILAASGTSTLEACILEVPVVVFYRVSPLTYLFRPLVKLRHYSIVNILAGQELVKELIQRDFTPENLAAEALHLLQDERARQRIVEGYRRVKSLFPAGSALERIASLLEEILTGQL